MLSRVADNLYWMSRYLERAEHTARLLDVNLHGMLDQTPQSAERRWDRLLASLGTDIPGADHDPYRITEALTTTASNPASIVSCVSAARDNARQVWEQISSEMWEQINRLHLAVSRRRMAEIWRGEPHAFFVEVKEGVHLFQGITDSTMTHGEGWQFIQLGRSLERAAETAALVDAHFTSPLASDDPATLAYLEWIGLLKSCTAFEAYVKSYSANVEPQSIAAFLLLSGEFPRSIRFVASGIRSSLQAIARTTGGRGGRPERLAGRLQAALEYGQIDEIMENDLHSYLESIRLQCDQIHTAIYQTFIWYPVAAALAAQGRAS